MNKLPEAISAHIADAIQIALVLGALVFLTLRMNALGHGAIIFGLALFFVGLAAVMPLSHLLGTLHQSLHTRVYRCPDCPTTIRVTHGTPEDPARYGAMALDHPLHR
ncbi:hypothetical protein, partial [Streptomyces sp. NPDC005877]